MSRRAARCAFRSASWSSGARPRANGSTITWRPVAVLAGQPDTPPWTALADDGERATFYAGPARSSSIARETANYRDNLAGGSPALWVVLRETGASRPTRSYLVTADPAEGEGMTAAGNDIVEPVPMPEPVRDAIAAFVAEHHVEEVFVKRKRDRAEPGGARTPRPGDTKGQAMTSRTILRTVSWNAGRAGRSKLSVSPPRPPSQARRMRRCPIKPPSPTALPGLTPRPRLRRNPTSISPACRRSIRSRRSPTSGDFFLPACRRSWRMRPFAARGRPIRRCVTSSASPRTPGTSPIRRRCPVSAHCPRAPTSRGWWRRFSVRARRRTIPRLNLCRHPRPKLPIAPQALAQNRFRSPRQHRPARTLITPKATSERIKVLLCIAIILLRRTTVMPGRRQKSPRNPASMAEHCLSR